MKPEKLIKFFALDLAGFVCFIILGLLTGSVKPVQAQLQSSTVESEVTDQGNGTFLYKFEVFNLSSPFEENDSDDEENELEDLLLVDWELPIFNLDDLNLSTITSPTDWTYEIVNLDGEIVHSPDSSRIGDPSDFFNNEKGPYGDYGWNYVAATDPLLLGDPDLYGPNPEVFETPPLILHWYTLADFEEEDDDEDDDVTPLNPIFPQQSLNGFSFESEFSSINAPYLSSWFFLKPVTGDPPIPGGAGFGTPNSPARQQAQSVTVTVPEPASILGMLAFGTYAAALGLKKREF